MIKYKHYTIGNPTKSSGEWRTQCPSCAEMGKQKIKDTCLAVNLDKEIFNCFKCGFTGYYGKVISNSEKQYTKPSIGNLTALKDEHLQLFSNRGITQKTVIRNGIKSAKNNWYSFIYYEGEDVVNIKYRDKNKKFMQAKDAKPTMYKYNDIINQENIIVCEGEFDALAWEEAGFFNATSVNAGAPNARDKNVEKKLECIYNCFDVFENAEIIYLSVDTDENGIRLQKELIKIFTAEKVKLIDHLDCKDANEVLLKHGKEKLKELYKNAKEVKVDGIFQADDFKDQILHNYRNRQPKGTTTYFENLDKSWTHRSGEVNLWTGYNNEGKSMLVKQLLLLKSKHEGWKHAIFSPEEVPMGEFFTDLIESYIGKSADIDQVKYNNYMTETQLLSGQKFINDHFYKVYPKDDHSVDELLKKFSYLCRKKNIKSVMFDPYNQIHHKMKSGEREDLYISRFMAKLKKFAVEHNVCMHLIAHQSTPIVQKDENYPMPNIYKIKGGGTFGDKADNVIAVWREHRNTNQSDANVKFISQKIKKQKLTGTPSTQIIQFHRQSNRYTLNMKSPFDDQIKEPEIELPISDNEGLEPANFDNVEDFTEIDEMPF